MKKFILRFRKEELLDVIFNKKLKAGRVLTLVQSYSYL